jgi:hypothetical protein
MDEEKNNNICDTIGLAVYSSDRNISYRLP